MRYQDTFKDTQTWNAQHRGVPIMGMARVIDSGQIQVTGNVTGMMRTVAVDDGGAVHVTNHTARPLWIATNAPIDTELPAAAALADTVANPTTPIIGAYAHTRDANATTYSRDSGELALALDDGIHSPDDNPLHISLAPKRWIVSAGTVGFYAGTGTTPGDEIDCRRFTKGAYYLELDSTSTPQDLQVALEFDPDGTGTWYQEVVWHWNKVIFDDTICAAGMLRRYPFETNGAHKVRITVIATVAAGFFQIISDKFTFQAAG